MKNDIIVWNCQGVEYQNFYKFLKEYLRDFDPDVVVLVEIRVSGVKVARVDSVNVVVEVNHFQFVHLKVKFLDLNDWVLKELWVELGSIAQNVRLPWILVGDFNALLNEEEKEGSLRKSRSILKFTWNRGLAFEHLDRVLCNYQWDHLVPNTMVHHLQMIKSDHSPLVVCFGQNNVKKPPRPFFFLGVNGNWGNGDQLEGSVWSFIATI
ncbi:hypothetical protein ES288_D07G199100v1 [Gossypium darwinii]|uniref:Endonuclease/exonuclease/phosphatase domain-containing protein n=1 Tax=Gossypium darwinii TaxID=34276 RepID=A0A5D2C1V3_GOSDA|nr:hypothetical protein ES288_D07G199100v1 [Gossypium darwinii]